MTLNLNHVFVPGGQPTITFVDRTDHEFAKELKKEITGFAAESIAIINAYPWPGNVRELQSAVKHSLLEATGPVIVPAYLPDAIRNTGSRTRQSLDSPQDDPKSGDLGYLNFAAMTRERLAAGSEDIHRELISLAEKEIFAEVLKQTDGNLTQAAKRLGITRTTLRARLESLGMSLEKSATIN